MRGGDADLCFVGAAAQAQLIRHGDVSARELVDAMLERIDALDPRLNAYRVVLAEQAREQARRVDQVRTVGHDHPLHGVPVAVKDTVDVAGEVTTWGTSANSTPARDDAPIVSSLRAAGAIIIGKTTCWNSRHGRSPRPPVGGNPQSVEHGVQPRRVERRLRSRRRGRPVRHRARLRWAGIDPQPASFTGVFGLKPQRGPSGTDPRTETGGGERPDRSDRGRRRAVVDATAVRPPPNRSSLPFSATRIHSGSRWPGIPSRSFR